MAGFPTATDQQIQERLAICRVCPEFIPDRSGETGACAKCCCPASDRLSKSVSKLAWRNEGCPLGKWPTLDAAAERE